jgi:hypothetical protein
MEFEKNTSQVSDEQRRLAETKKLTLRPIHEDIAPEDMPDSQLVASHLTGPALQNAPNDMEQSSRPLQPVPQNQRPTPTAEPKRSLYPRLLAGAVVLACAGVTVAVLLRSQ